MPVAIAVVLILSAICFFFIFFKRGGPPEPKVEYRPVSGAPAASSNSRIDLSAFDKICEEDGEVDYWPLPGNDYQVIRELLEDGKPITPVLLNRNPPIKISYIDNKEVRTIREIIPFRIIGSIDQGEDGVQKEYDFYIEAFCLLRKGERSFHTNGILAAWSHGGKEINLGDYLADLYRRTRRH